MPYETALDMLVGLVNSGSEYTVNFTKTREPVSAKHTGTWIMSKESAEWHQLPSEIREKFRAEKNRRIATVSILPSITVLGI